MKYAIFVHCLVGDKAHKSALKSEENINFRPNEQQYCLVFFFSFEGAVYLDDLCSIQDSLSIHLRQYFFLIRYQL